MSEYYRFVNLPKNFINADVLDAYYKIANLKRFGHWRLEGEKLNIISNEVMDWFKKMGCSVTVGEIFYTPPNNNLSWHIDGSKDGHIFDYVKFNFVWSDHNTHYMQWGKLVDPSRKPSISYNATGSSQMIFNSPEIIETKSVTANKPILVNVGVPHRVINDGDTGRWCLCLIPKKNDARISFNDALKIFSEYVQD